MRRRSMSLLGVTAVSAIVLSLSPVSTARPGGRILLGPPGPLRGIPLHGRTHLRLLIADVPPFVLDVDSGRRFPIEGLPQLPRNAVVGVFPAGNDAAIWVDSTSSDTRVPQAEIYVVQRGTTHAQFIGEAWDVAPTNVQTLWLLRYVDREHCVVQEVTVDGAPRSADIPVSCSTTLLGGKFGVESGTPKDTLIDLATGRELLRAEHIFAAAGAYVLGARPPLRLSIIDANSRARTQLRWPSQIGELDRPAVSPNQRFVAVGFGDPAYGVGGAQALDVWLLELSTKRMRELPSMPAIVLLKFTSMAWADNRRLVFLAQTKQRTVLGIWRRGAKKLAIERIRLPARTGGSDTFVAW